MSCSKEIKTPNEAIPEFEESVNSKMYYKNWKECEMELEQVYKVCDELN